MPIKITCQCGQGFAAKEELAGRTLKCPKCGTRLNIPQPKPPEQPAEPKQRQQPAPKPKQPVAKPKQPQPKQPGQPRPPDAIGDLLEEAGMDGAAPPNVCPECRTVMAQGAVLCVNCGYNAKLGRRMEAKREVADGAPKRTKTPSEVRGWITVDAGLSVSFFSLIIGATAFSIIAIVVFVAMESPPTQIMRFFTGAGGRFVSIILPWSALAFAASYMSLVTGWLVCRAVPPSTEAHSRIQSTVGCVGAMLVFLLLMQLIPTMMMPSMPKPPELGQSRNPAEMQRAMAERREFQQKMQSKEFQQKMQSRAKMISHITKVLFLLVWLALIGGFAAFGLFLGAVGGHFRRGNLQQLAIFFAIFQGACALWVILLTYVIEPDSPSMAKLILIVCIVLALATYGWLIYLVREAHGLVRAGS